MSGLGWEDQNEAYKEYTIRVMKYSAPQFADVNLHTWEPKGLMAGYLIMKDVVLEVNMVDHTIN